MLRAAFVSAAKTSAKPGRLGVVAIFVPPAVLDEVEAVFYLPMIANVGLQFRGRDGGRIEAGREIAAFGKQNLTLGRTHFAIDAEDDLTIGKV